MNHFFISYYFFLITEAIHLIINYKKINKAIDNVMLSKRLIWIILSIIIFMPYINIAWGIIGVYYFITKKR